MRRLALPAAALLAAVALNGCRSAESFVSQCRARGGGEGADPVWVQQCAERTAAETNAYTADTWAGLLAITAIAVAPRAACQTVSEPYRGGWRTRSVCW